MNDGMCVTIGSGDLLIVAMPTHNTFILITLRLLSACITIIVVIPSSLIIPPCLVSMFGVNVYYLFWQQSPNIDILTLVSL